MVKTFGGGIVHVEGKSEPWLTLQHTQATPYLSMAKCEGSSY